jgi:N-hydroxyarylamine O-acetyltransferase
VIDAAAYLRRIGIDDDLGPPSVQGLFALHRAHVERVPYETIEIQLGRPTTVDPHEAYERIVGKSRGGYCYHLNGSFSLLLDALGYDVTWHRAGVQVGSEPEPVGATGSHLALTVSGLPADDNPEGGWMVDAGLGNGIHEPLPLVPGRYRQGPLDYELRRSSAEPGGWRFEQDPRLSWIGMDFRPGVATQDDFAEQHDRLSTDPESPFVRWFTVQRRHADGIDALVDREMRHIPGDDGTVLGRADWLAVLHDVFGIELDAGEADALWARVQYSR